ncbi:MAG: cobyrinate a,c-diamide synthase, partial [Nitrospirae bacterium]|nr:cobyrinate a,c-diamide synthase [Nitrospirota bacterium]
MARGIVIAGTHSGCGKTTITLGILKSLKEMGFNVQAFKVGPDFIDPGLHEIITKNQSRNLDIWMCGKDYVLECFYKNTEDADIAVVEGVMGLFDGGVASTAEVAKTLGLPVVLIVDAHSMAESVAALIKGFETFDQKIKIAGVIFNKVASKRHFKMLSDTITKYSNVKVLGYLPKKAQLLIPERHLGLLTKEESPISKETLTMLSKAIKENINIRLLLKLTKSSTAKPAKDCPSISNSQPQMKIAIARDRAFCFYYKESLDLLRKAGGKIVTFSPLSDKKIPDNVDAIYIGGGYPELYAYQLSRNVSMLRAIRKWADSGRPIYAE